MGRRTALPLFVVIVAVATVLAGCPLPFEFTPADTASAVASTSDPANPRVTAPPTFVVVQTSTGVAIDASGSSVVSNRNVRVQLESDTRGAIVYYTTDGNPPLPGQGSTRRYSDSEPIELTTHGVTTTVRAIAVASSMYPSVITTRDIAVVYDQVASPVFSPVPGNYDSDQTITLSTATPGATIYYRIVDGTGGAAAPAPGAIGTLEYTGPIVVAGTGTAKSISAIAVRSEMVASAVSTGVYTIGYTQAGAPVFSPPGGVFASGGLVVEMSSASAGATIWYTLDGSDPVPGGSSSITSGGSITVTNTTTVRAVATAPGFTQSPIATATYTATGFALLTRADIVAIDAQMTGTPIDNSDGNRIPVGAVILYVTRDERYGKLLVTVSDGSNNNGLTFDHVTYAADGSVHASGLGTTVTGTWGFDLDLQGAGQGDGVHDFWLSNATATDRSFNPQVTARFYLVP